MSTPQEQAILASINPSGTIKTSLSIYLPVLGGALLVFEALRRRFRQAYDSRRFSATGAWTPPGGDGLFAWVPAVLRTSDDEIFARCGLDTLCYLRVLRLGQRVALLVVVLSAALFPLYATATPPQTVRVKVDPLERITMSNLATGDWRLWAATVASYVVTLFTLSLLLHEYRHYVARRHELLAKHDAPMYTVLMNDLPLKLRTRQTLEQYMRKVFPDAVHSVYVTLDCARLEELVEEREKTRDALEHALAVAERKGGGLESARPTHRDGGSYAGMLCCQRGSCGTRVDSVDFYQERLVKLNGLVAREIRSLEDAQAQLARQVEQQEHGDVKPPPTMTPEEEQQLIARVEAENEAELQHEHEEAEAEKEQVAADQHRRSSHQRSRTASSSHPSGASPRRSLSAPPLHPQSYHTAISIGSRHDHDEDDYFEEDDDNDTDFDDQDGDGDNDEDEATSLTSGDQEAEMDARERRRRLKPIRVMQRSAFVSFKTLMAAQVAQQALQASNPVAMATTPAPYVDDIHWSNIGRHYHTRAMGRLVASALTVLIVIFWTIPTAFVTSLATVESLRKELPFLNKAFDKHPALEDLFKQLAPLLLVILVALAPVVFKLLSSREGYASNTELNASVFTKLAFFQLVQIFFVTVIVGTVIDSLKVIIDQPKVLINMLGRSMPQQSTFFMSFILVRTGLSLMLELLRVGPLVLALIFKIMSPQLTRRERNGSWLGMTAISNTDPFEPTSQLADAFLALLVTLTFATIAPLVCYFTGFFFLVAELVYRRQVMFVYRSSTHSMGAYWPRLYRFLITALVVSQLTLLGLLSLKKAPGASAAVFVLLIIILLFHHYVSRLYPRAAKYLPLTQCVRIDAQRRHRDKPRYAGSGHDLNGGGAFEFLDNVYRQPAMSQAPPLRVDYQMLEDEFGPEGGIVSSPEMHNEDQRLFAPRGPL